MQSVYKRGSAWHLTALWVLEFSFHIIQDCVHVLCLQCFTLLNEVAARWIWIRLSFAGGLSRGGAKCSHLGHLSSYFLSQLHLITYYLSPHPRPHLTVTWWIRVLVLQTTGSFRRDIATNFSVLYFSYCLKHFFALSLGISAWKTVLTNIAWFNSLKESESLIKRIQQVSKLRQGRSRKKFKHC